MTNREITLKLIEPTADLKAEFLAMAREFEAGENTLVQGIGSIDINDFDASVERAKDHARGVGLPDGWVPAATYWLVRQNRLIGTVNLRYELNDFLREIGGHIGYSIRPSEQNKGYGTWILALTLEKAKAIGLTKVLVTCDKSNIGSRRVIEKNGGVLENEVIANDTGKPLLRFWIDLASDLRKTGTVCNIPVDKIVEIDKLNMTCFINALGGTFDPQKRRQKVLEEISGNAIFLLVYRDVRLAGYIEYQSRDDLSLNVMSIQIHPEFRNGSVLRELLSKAYRQIHLNPPSEVTTSVHVNNDLSRKLNHKLGFELIREEKDRMYFIAGGKNLLCRLSRFARKQ